MLNEDYKDILRSLLRNRARFLVVGAYAMGVHGYPRATGDFDIWVEASLKNSQRIYRALSEFGAPLSKLTKRTFAGKSIVFQIGVPPRRIDVITHIDGVTFDVAYRRRMQVTIEGLTIPFLSKRDLIRNKEATGREKDRLDVKSLRRTCQ